MENFKKFNICDELLKSIENLGYTTPSEIQSKIIPLALNNKDLIGKSQTGSGKTAAFGIPICENINIELNKIQSLILAPTRELCIQIKNVLSEIGLYKKIKVISLYGKEPFSLQRDQLKQRVHIAVGTPGRVLDHINRGTLDLSNIKQVVIDEADEMLNMGFISQVENIIKALPKNHQTMMFSATISPEIKDLSRKYMKNDFHTVEVNGNKLTLDTISQNLFIVEDNKKVSLLIDLFKAEDIKQCILFCRTKDRVEALYEKLKKFNIPICELHGNMLQKDRTKTIEDFKKGKFIFMVATDVAARGIDISSLSHVINYDVPLEKEAYIHRIGRSGRAFTKGTSITLATPYEDKFIKAIEEYINMEIPQKPLPEKESFNNIRIENKYKIKKENVKETLNKNDVTKIFIKAGKKKKIRRGDIVGTLINMGNIPSDSIGIIDIFDNHSYVDILNGYGKDFIKNNKEIKIKGKTIKIEKANK